MEFEPKRSSGVVMNFEIILGMHGTDIRFNNLILRDVLPVGVFSVFSAAQRSDFLLHAPLYRIPVEKLSGAPQPQPPPIPPRVYSPLAPPPPTAPDHATAKPRQPTSQRVPVAVG
jgi:hypothetical protein